MIYDILFNIASSPLQTLNIVLDNHFPQSHCPSNNDWPNEEHVNQTGPMNLPWNWNINPGRLIFFFLPIGIAKLVSWKESQSKRERRQHEEESKVNKRTTEEETKIKQYTNSVWIWYEILWSCVFFTSLDPYTGCTFSLSDYISHCLKSGSLPLSKES